MSPEEDKMDAPLYFTDYRFTIVLFAVIRPHSSLSASQRACFIVKQRS